MILEKSPTIIGKMFDRIAPRYDLINRVTSFGQDVRWRKKLIQFIPHGNSVCLLDLATGTGDVLITLLRASSHETRGIGIDLSEQMIFLGKVKLTNALLDDRATMQVGDATAIPLLDASVDLVTMAFGIRNVNDVPKVLSEIHRVLKPGGSVVILEFSLPQNFLIRFFYLLYFRIVLPIVGGLLSGCYDAYRYLTHSVESFVYGEEFCKLLRDAAFEGVFFEPLCLGVATLYVGKKNG